MSYDQVSGIGIVYAETLELAGRIPQSSAILGEIWALRSLKITEIDNYPETDALRRAAIAHKLGDLATSDEEEEKWRVRAVEGILGGVLNSQISSKCQVDGKDGRVVTVNLSELSLPTWVYKSDIGAPLEALGVLYVRTNRNSYVFFILMILSLTEPYSDGQPPYIFKLSLFFFLPKEDLLWQKNVTVR